MLDETTEQTGYWLTHKHACDGISKNTLRTWADNDKVILYLQKSINLTNHLHYQLNKMLFIVEFHLKNKKMISKDNVYFLAVDILIIKLLKILDQDSITKYVDFLNYWKCLINNNCYLFKGQTL